MARERDVFMSYARVNGEEFARVRERLHHESPYLGAVWLDRAEMEEGVGRWWQITEGRESRSHDEKQPGHNVKSVSSTRRLSGSGAFVRVACPMW